jgi:protein involved in temperature-dependent protein secretion
MATSDLPKWVWDLVIALQKHEDEHGDEANCHAPVLGLIPKDIGHQADAIRRYADMARTDTVMKQAKEQWSGLADSLTAKKKATP